MDSASTIDKICSFFELCFYILGTVGGVLCCALNKALPVAVGVGALAFWSFPHIKEVWQKLVS